MHTTMRLFLRSTIAAAILLACLLHTRPSHADQPFMFQLYVGLGGEMEIGEVEVGGGNVDVQDDEEDLDTHFGLAGFYLVPVVDHVLLGGRLGYFTSEGDETDAYYGVLDLGPWLRVEILTGLVRPFVDLGLGLSHVWYSDDDWLGLSDWELSANGFGFHLLLGGGVAYSVSPDVSLHAGLYYGYQTFPGVDGEWDSPLGDGDFEADGSIDRILLAVGVQF